MKKTDKYLIFTIALIIVATIVFTVLQLIFKEIELIEYYKTLVSLFGAPEILGCVVIKCFNIKNNQ